MVILPRAPLGGGSPMKATARVAHMARIVFFTWKQSSNISDQENCSSIAGVLRQYCGKKKITTEKDAHRSQLDAKPKQSRYNLMQTDEIRGKSKLNPCKLMWTDTKLSKQNSNKRSVTSTTPLYCINVQQTKIEHAVVYSPILSVRYCKNTRPVQPPP